MILFHHIDAVYAKGYRIIGYHTLWIGPGMIHEEHSQQQEKGEPCENKWEFLHSFIGATQTSDIHLKITRNCLPEREPFSVEPKEAENLNVLRDH